MKKRLFINGIWKETMHYAPLYSPYSEEIIAEIPLATAGEVDSAIAAAEEAADVMRNMPAVQRSGILYQLSELLERNKDKAAELLSLEASKPLKSARTEIERTIQTYRLAAEEAKRMYGETIPMDAVPGGEGRFAYTVREPRGVIGAITPFNFPFNLVAHKVGPALASGNTVVLKPAAQAPLSALFLAEMLSEAGLPKGALNVVTGDGKVVGKQIVTDPRVKMVTFTGSPEVGQSIHNQAGLKKVTLELGSNSAVIVDHVRDLNSIIPRCVASSFSYQGQVCISLQRIYVHEAVYAPFVERFVAETSHLKIGDPLDETTDIAALINGKEVKRTMEWINEAQTAGAKVAIGGRAERNVLLPTVILNASPALKVSCQEVFAPIVVIHSVRSVEEAIEQVNDSRYGLQAGIYTDDVRTAFQAARKLQVGGVMVNDTPTFRVDHMPYGGVKESGTGKEGVKYAMEEMTEMKLVVFNKV